MKKILFTLIVLFICGLNSAFSVPANPNPVKYTQPDGKELTIKLIGDEYLNRRMSIDGYTLMIDEKGYLTYAVINSNGDLVASNVIAKEINNRDVETIQFLSGIRKNLNYSRKQIDVMRQVIEPIYDVEKSNSSRGNSLGSKKLICALVGFPDEPFEKTVAEFTRLMNQQGYDNGKGSVRDYFIENSYGKLDLEVVVAGPYTAPKNESAYWQNGQALARWVMQQVGEDYDMSEFDNDNDGYVDGFHFIFAGNGRESTGIQGTIWSHKSYLEFPLTIDGKRLKNYSCSPERSGSSKTAISTIGVVCHEMSHCFGAPDYYDTDNNGTTEPGYIGTGDWDLMANGCYNGSPQGSIPSGHNMYQKIDFEWVTPIELTDPKSIYAMPNSAEHPIAYIIKTKTPDEYFVLENRQKVGFDKAIPGTGLIIYRVGKRVKELTYNNIINASHPQMMYPICASSNLSIPNELIASYGNINTTGCPFPGSSNKTSFTDDSTPSSKSWDGQNTEKPITNIAENKEMLTIAFDFMGGMSSDCQVPANLTGKFTMGVGVELAWDAVAGTEGYNVFRNDILIASDINATSYIDKDYNKIDYVYYVTSKIGDCQSNPSNLVLVSVTKDIYNISVEMNKEGVGSVEGAGEYEKGTKVILRARVEEGHKFLYWYAEGEIVSKSTLYQFNAVRNVNIVAVFDEPYQEPGVSVPEKEELSSLNIFSFDRTINVIGNLVSDNAVLNVIDINGRTIFHEIISGDVNSKISIDKRGIYIVRIVENNNVISKKIIL